ncbi:MAG TPA: bifunctional glutamate N-acetyltransferase/amino-acid acetyltransferase ArgJ [Solirubrobacteraceae bacterium]|jgi:glutamate N-acetyltransferase/amino-acid N-acetyltransferase|nr:bifunctional glutamate N-acetyltransferase/amino-acid acetyltransferase ArgJ [Solirubrobacteraceae bacterium]
MSAGSDVWGDRASDGPPRPFFDSRWVAAPAHVRELDPDAGLPAGFRAAGIACGIKPSGNPDVGLLICDTASPAASSAARFTATATAAAPVLLSRDRCELGALRAVLVNSGCANAATGQRGLDDAAKTQGAAALALGLAPEQVALASTGGISHLLPVEKLLKGILEATPLLRREGDSDLQQAIQTTDAFEKRANLELTLPSGTVRLSAQCKGAGMISPNFATMLCFIETDAALAAETADLLLGVCVKRSFDRCSVDGQLSTNDTAILIASGASGVRIESESEDELRFGEALDALLRQLAIMMVADGEGAGRIARVVVRGAAGALSEAAGDSPAGRALASEPVELVARAVANSPLVKTALHGADPNWGRLIQAVGTALAGHPRFPAPLAVDLSIEGTLVCSAGAAIDYDEDALAQAVQAREIEYEIALPGDGAETEVFFSDLGHQYVTINAEYTT